MATTASSWKTHALLFVMSGIYGAFFPLLKLLCQTVAPLDAAMLRSIGFALCILAFGGLWGFWKWRNIPWKMKALIAFNAFIGVFMVQTMAPIAMPLTSSFHATLIMGSIPLQTTILSTLLGMEKLTVRKLVGVLIGSAGLAGLVWLQLQDGSGSSVHTAKISLAGGNNPLLGDAIIFGNAFMFSGFNLITKYLVSKYRPITLLSYGFLQSGMLALALVLVNEIIGLPLIPKFSHLVSIIPSFTGQSWALLAYMILIAGFFGYWIHHSSLKKTSASNVALYMLLQPLMSAFLGYFLLKEVFTIPMVLAGGLIIAGLLVVACGNNSAIPK